MGQLDGRVAMITGGARGMGRAHALTLAGEGADVVICDIDTTPDSVEYPLSRPGDLVTTREMVEAEGRRCIAEIVDVRDLDALEALARRTADELGSIDLMVANAGTFASSRCTR